MSADRLPEPPPIPDAGDGAADPDLGVLPLRLLRPRAKPAPASAPIMDEYGYYAPSGLSSSLAAARSIGFATIF